MCPQTIENTEYKWMAKGAATSPKKPLYSKWMISESNFLRQRWNTWPERCIWTFKWADWQNLIRNGLRGFQEAILKDGNWKKRLRWAKLNKKWTKNLWQILQSPDLSITEAVWGHLDKRQPIPSEETTWLSNHFEMHKSIFCLLLLAYLYLRLQMLPLFPVFLAIKGVSTLFHRIRMVYFPLLHNREFHPTWS